MDLIAHAMFLGHRDGKEWYELPSASFIAKCKEYLKEHPDYKHSPP